MVNTKNGRTVSGARARGSAIANNDWHQNRAFVEIGAEVGRETREGNLGHRRWAMRGTYRHPLTPLLSFVPVAVAPTVFAEDLAELAQGYPGH